MYELTTRMVADLPQSGPTDPIAYYRRPLVGQLFRRRINLGLGLLPARRFARALEVGYGAGAVQLALGAGVDELHGIDLDADPGAVVPLLEQKGITPHLARGSVYELPYERGWFDLVVSFSVFEHLADYPRALAEVARVLKPGGFFLLGMPAVNLAMEAGFRAIGFKGIEDHHVTRPRDVAARVEAAGLLPVRSAHLDVPLPPPAGMRLYYNWLHVRAG